MDASVVVDALTAAGAYGRTCRERLAGEETLHAPAMLRAEVASALRRHTLSGRLPAEKARAALIRSGELAITEYLFKPFQLRAWGLRHTVSSYDAWYVALAEALGTRLITSDQRLARASGPHCDVELISASS